MIVTVPGNLLLFGEYAATLKGGLGLALALDTYIKIEATPASHLTISGTFQGESYTWKEGDPFPSSLRLIETILNGVSEHLERSKGIKSQFPLNISLDSSCFCYENGQKKGFGSSAAITCGLTYLLLYEACKKAPAIKEEVLPLALKIHRKFQGGKGSGYDIFTSLYGGAGLFTGEEMPTWQDISPFWTDSLYIARGDSEVSTQGALNRLAKLIENNPTTINKFLLESNTLIEQIIKNYDRTQTCNLFQKASELNHWIHDQMQLLSEGPNLKKTLDHYRKKGYPAKSLGSGGEIAAILAFNGKEKLFQKSSQIEPLKLARRGLRCER